VQELTGDGADCTDRQRWAKTTDAADTSVLAGSKFAISCGSAKDSSHLLDALQLNGL
jgi:hypothetical protein